MNLDNDQVRAAFYCVAEVTRQRLLIGAPIPQWLRNIHHALSPTGQETVAPQVDSESPDELIGTEQAAAILGLHPRTVRRIATDLDGQIVANRWCFTRTAVTEYAENRTETT